jgi:hypothetical protein
MEGLNVAARTTSRSSGEEDETMPLLASQFDPDEEEWELEMEVQSEVQSKYEELSREIFPRFSRKRFYFACGLGLVALLILHLFFLQRTSWSRDMRRWYGLHLTASDVKRTYLRYSGIGNTIESKASVINIENWIKNFTEINSQSPVNLVADDNLQLTYYVESNFKKFGFQTKTYLYNLPNLQRPISSHIQLVDASTNGEIVYDAKLKEADFQTPAYHGFGANASVCGDFIFVNFGTNDDYQLLLNEKFVIKDKIVIVQSSTNSNFTLSDKVTIAERYGAVGLINYLAPSSTISSANSDLYNSAIPRSTVADSHFNTKMTTIPVIPISYKSILPILNTLPENKAQFDNWDFYPATPKSKFHINMSAIFEEDPTRKLTNIVGTFPGIFQDGCIVIGSSRDSFTSSSPSSNHVVMLETMRIYRRLIKLGWKPLRTIHFVSWDASGNDLFGSQLLTNDSTTSLNIKQPILGYINIDSDCVTGSKFEVDANPMLHHLVHDSSKYIPIPKSLVHDDSYANEKDGITTLHHYWLKQDNRTINDRLGLELRNSDSLIVQDRWSAPIINMKFANDPKRDASVYVPNSSLYSYDWLMKMNEDSLYYYHVLLIRLVGLLGITLSEREMVDYRVNTYFNRLGKFFEEFVETNDNDLRNWCNRTVPMHLVSNWQIFQDIKFNDATSIQFGSLVDELKRLLDRSVQSTKNIDIYNQHIQQELQRDVPWYKYPRKLVTFAQFKLANYNALRIEKGFKLNNKDIQYLNFDNYPVKHIIYGLPKCSNFNDTTANKCFGWTTFTNLHESVQANDFHSTVKWLVIIYEKLHAFDV